MEFTLPASRGAAPIPSSDNDTTPPAAAGRASLLVDRAATLAALGHEMQTLEKAVFHLTRSNNELRAALEEEEESDSENKVIFQQAISENVDVIAKKLASSPARNSSITTCAPASPNAPSNISASAVSASMRVGAITTPLPAAKPSALST